MKNRLMAIILAAASLLCVLSTAACKKSDSDEGGSLNTSPTSVQVITEPEHMTRAEWIALLGDAFGMDEYVEDTPFFSDVTSGDNAFAYVQSCAEWGVLDIGESSFKPNEKATREFVAITAVLTADIPYEEQSGESNSTKQYNAAVASGIIIEGNLSDALTFAEGRAAAAIAKKLYLDLDFVVYENITLEDTVLDFSSRPAQNFDISENTVNTTDTSLAYLSVGDIFITPATPAEPYGVAKKVVAITEVNGEIIIETTEPELEEVFAEIDFAAVGQPIVEGISVADGVSLEAVSTLVGNDDDALRISPLSNTEMATQIADPLSLTFNINLTKGSISVVPKVGIFEFEGEQIMHMSSLKKDATREIGQWFNKTNYIYDKAPSVDRFKINKDGWEQRLTAQNKFTGGYEITGSLSISDLYVNASTELKKAFGVPYGIETCTIEKNFNTSINLSAKGTISDELKISTIPFSLAFGITIDLDLILYADFSGEMQAKFESKNNTKIESTGGSTKKVSNQEQSLTGEVSVELEFGPAVAVTLKALGIRIVDAKLKAGVLISASATDFGRVLTERADGIITNTYQIGIRTSVDLYVPIISISLSNKDTLANRVGIKGSWKLYSKDNAKKFSWFENEWIFWEYIEEMPDDGLDDVDMSPDIDINADADASADNPFAGLIIQDVVITLVPGSSNEIVITSYPSGVKLADLTFESKKPSVATVNASGVITAVSPGTTQIFIKGSDGSLQVCVVFVEGTEAGENWSFISGWMHV